MTLTESVDDVVEESDNPLLRCHGSWDRIRLEEVADVLNGNAFSSDYFTNGEGKPLLRIRDIGETSTEKNFAGEYEERYLVTSGDLVVGMDGDFVCDLWKGPEALLNQRVCKITPDESIYNKKFLYYVLQPYLDAIHARTSATTVKHLSSTDVKEIPLPSPPINEQERIVAKIEELFSKLDSGVSELEKSQDRLELYKKAALNEALKGRFSRGFYQEEQGVEPRKTIAEIAAPDNAPELPATWIWVRFEDILSEPLRNGKSAKKSEEGIRALTLSAVTERDFSGKNTKITEANPEDVEDLWLQSGDLLIERSNTEEYVGLPAVYRGEDNYAIYPDLMIRARLDDSLAIPEYADYVLLSPFFRNYLRDKSKGTSGSMAKINQKHLRNIPFPLAPLEEQEHLIGRLDHIMSIVDESQKSVNNEIKRAQRLRQSILKRAFEGNLVPQDPTEEPPTPDGGNTNLEPGKQATLSEVTSDVE